MYKYRSPSSCGTVARGVRVHSYSYSTLRGFGFHRPPPGKVPSQGSPHRPTPHAKHSRSRTVGNDLFSRENNGVPATLYNDYYGDM